MRPYWDPNHHRLVGLVASLLLEEHVRAGLDTWELTARLHARTDDNTARSGYVVEVHKDLVIGLAFPSEPILRWRFREDALGHDQDLTVRKAFVEELGRGNGVEAGKPDVDDRDVRLRSRAPPLRLRSRGLFSDRVYLVQLVHDLNVLLEPQKGDECAADHVHFLGDQDADHSRRPAQRNGNVEPEHFH
jgi:hypothetical protein